jgi:hypothetical protein
LLIDHHKRTVGDRLPPRIPILAIKAKVLAGDGRRGQGKARNFDREAAAVGATIW